MTAEELASKELAEWREREAKHQLEIIKKTELELATMSKKYNVVKTHKGEEIIEEVGESKAEDRGIVVEPVTEILQDTTSQHKSHMFDLNCKICTGKEKESKENRDKHREKDKHKEKERRRESSSKHKKKDKERDKERERKHDKEKSKEKDREKDKDKEKKSREDEKKSGKDNERERRHSHHKHSEKSKEKSSKKEETKNDGVTKKEETQNDDLLKKEDVKNDAVISREEIKMEVKEQKDPEKNESPVTEEARAVEGKPEEKKVKETEVEKQEPTSTVNIKTPEIENSPTTQGFLWKGIINSSEVGKFAVQAYEMTTNIDLSDTLTKDSLDIVGRIHPQMVWDYIMQTRKVGTRDVALVHFQPKSDGDRKFYNSFLSHMYKSNRFAVVGPVSKMVKDFYIVPLPKDSPIPTVLTALAADSQVLDENRTSVLIGVIVRSRAKTANIEPREKHAPRQSKHESKLTYIPTSKSSTKRKTNEEISGSTRKAKAPRPSTEPDDDIPYSPSQIVEEGESTIDQHQLTLQELNSKIEQQKNELISLAAKVSPKDVETLIPGLEPVIPGLEPSGAVPRSASEPETGLTSISIPNNLQEILSAIQQKEEELTKLSQMVELSSGDVDLRDLSAPMTGDVDMRQIHQPDNSRRDPRRKSLNQLTDEELLAKAMEMETANRPFPGPPPPSQAPPLGPHGPQFYPGPSPMLEPPGPMHPMGSMMGPRPPPYGPGFLPPRPPFPPRGPAYWGPPRPGPMPPRGPRPR